MLIINAYVNHKYIGELCIHNLGNVAPAKIGGPITDDLCLYQIEKPVGHMEPEYRIEHRRSDGWEELVRKACEVMKAKKYGDSLRKQIKMQKRSKLKVIK